MVEINFEKSASSDTIPIEPVKKALLQILADHGFSDGWINIVIIDDKMMIEMHKNYFNDPNTTDVMSFEFDIDRESRYMEGEVYANIEQVQRQAKQYNTTVENELNRVIIHGVLHLVGYDDKTAEQKKIMRDKEDFYLKLL